MKKQEKIENTFLDILCLISSFLLGFFRSVKSFFSGKKIKKNYAFDTLDFLFRVWPKYFWKSPSLYKVLMLPADFIRDVFQIGQGDNAHLSHSPSVPPLKKREKSKQAFTLIEMMVSLLIIGIIIPVGFYAYSAAIASKAKIIQNTNIQQEALYFSERLFQMIKEGGGVDYEQYFNICYDRKESKSIHYGYLWRQSQTSNAPPLFSNFGNTGFFYAGFPYGKAFYYCVGQTAGERCQSGLVSPKFNNQNPYSGDVKKGYYDSVSNPYPNDNVGSEFSRYGQYYYQHIDFGSDQDGDNYIIGDADDVFLGIGPIAFDGTNNACTGRVNGDSSFGDTYRVSALYLISQDQTERTFFRWNYQFDPDATGGSCSSNERTTEDRCRGTIEFLKLEGKDWGMGHDPDATDDADDPDDDADADAFIGDGSIDTWVVHPDFDAGYSAGGYTLALDEYDDGDSFHDRNYWQPLFSENIDITDFKIFLYPNKNREYNWADPEPSTHVAPYARIVLKLRPSWKVRKNMRGEVPEFDFSTTVSLGGVLSER